MNKTLINPPPHSCQGLHLYHEVFGIFLQLLAGGTSLIRDPLYSVPVIPRVVLCMIRVYALYGRSRRVLGVLLMIGAASMIFTSVRFPFPPREYPLTSLSVFLLVGNGRKPSRHVRDDRSHVQPFGMQPVFAEQRVSADPVHLSSGSRDDR